MLRVSAILMVLLIATVVGVAQMTVVSTTPFDGAVSVPTTFTLGVTFSQPLDTTFQVGSRGAVSIMIMSGGMQTFGDYSYSGDLLTYHWDLSVNPNRDYFFVVADARSASGDTLRHFTPVRFSTASARGDRSISGQIESGNGDLNRTVVFLTEQYPIIEPNMFDGSLGCLYNTAESRYAVGDARSGHAYWICVLQFIDFGNSQVFLGFYDPDHDGHADSVVVGSSDYTDIDITMPLGVAEPHDHGIPVELSLDQNYPNPFNPSTTLRFGVPNVSRVALDVFDILGRKTTTLFSGMAQPGEHAVVWNCPSCPSGMYFARLRAAGQTTERKLMLLK